MPCVKVAVVNIKGGTGKTTIALNLAEALARRGRRLLVIDADPQANATATLGKYDDRGVGDLFEDPKATVSNIARPSKVDGVDLCASSLNLVFVEEQHRGKPLSALTFRQRFDAKAEDRYDFCFIDLSPYPNLFMQNALLLADFYLVPMSPAMWSLDGVKYLNRAIDDVRSGNPALARLGVVMTRIDGRQTLITRDMREACRAAFGPDLFETELSEATAFDQAASRRMTIFQHDPRQKTHGPREFNQLAVEFERRVEAKRAGAAPEATVRE